jgi:hypothetical protein
MISGRRQNVASQPVFRRLERIAGKPIPNRHRPKELTTKRTILVGGKNDTNMLAVLIGLNISSEAELTAVVGQLLPLHGAQSFLRAKRKRSGKGYGAISIWRQAAGRSASVIGGLGFGGVVGSLGWRTGSLNQ